MGKEKITCPICSSEKIKKFCEKNNYILYSCQDCSVTFVWPILDNLDNKIYKEEYFKNNGQTKSFGYTDYDKDKEPMKKVFKFYLDKFAKLTSGRKIFDLGTATGYFLDLAKKHGWQTAGIEISDYAARAAIARGHKVVWGQLPEVVINETFDVITMWDVLEHLDAPKKYLKAVNKILKSDGLLVINTVDKNSWWARVMGKHWQMIVPPEHLFYYSKKNLQLLLQGAGFQIIETKKIGKRFSLAYIFKTLYNWQHLEIWRKLEKYFNKPSWRKFAVPINLRDNIFIVAKKFPNS